MDSTTAFAFIIGMLVLGRGLAAARLLPDSTPDVLNAVVLQVCLPAAVLLHAPALRLSSELLRVAVLPWLLLLLSVLAVQAVARWRRWPDATRAVLLLAIPLGNTAFLGYPLVSTLLGEAALPHAVAYDQLGTFVMLSTFGLFIVARYAHDSRPAPTQMLLRILRFPPFIALLLALILMPDRYPTGVETVLRRLADALLPLVTLAIGMQVRLRLPREHLGPLAFGLTGKLIVLPLLALLLCGPLGILGPAREAVVLEAAMPTMITAMALAAAARLAPELGAALVGYGTVLSVALLPLWLALLR